MHAQNLPKKCICQLCTCGRHMCPHRKKTPPVAAEGTQDIKKADLSVVAGDGRKQRKQWNLSNGQADDVIASTEKASDRKVLSDTTNLAAVSVGGKGRSNVNYIADDFTSRQIHKTLPIKRPDNLKQEGNADFTTIHQQDFQSKSRRNLDLDPQHISSMSEIQNDSWNKKQIPKTQIIRKPDTLSFNGPVSLETTHKATYNEKTLGGSEYDDEKSEKISPKEVQHRSRPRTSLKLSGDLQSESSYQREYTPKRLEEDIKVRKDTPFDNLRPEGEMRFDTTSLDYNATVQFSRLSENAEDSIAANLNIQRPQSVIKIPPVALSDATTVTTDYKKWNVEKPVRYKPEDSLKFADSELEETYGSKAENVLRSRIETSQQDYKGWEGKYERTMIMKPENNLRPEGDFNFYTTHDVDYASTKGQRSRNSRLATNLETLDERYDNDVLAVASNKELPERHEREQETHAIISGTAIEQDQNQESSQIQPGINNYSEASKAETGYNEQSVSLSDEIELNSESYTHDDMQNQHYLTWDQIRPKPIRPHSNLKQEGGMEFNTTNRSEFIERPLERVRGIRPRTTTKLPEGDFDGVTMNQFMFSDDRVSKVSPIRPKSNLHVEEGHFTNETTSSKEFQPWDVKRPLPIIHKSNLAQEGSMDFTTTHHTEFEEKHPEKIYPIRPRTTNKVSEGEFDETTTTRMMHPEFPLDRVKKIVPQSNLRTSSGAFESETTNRMEFQNWGFDRPHPIRPVSNLRQEGKMDFITTNQTQFDEKTMEKVHQFRPQTYSKTTGDFDGTTTNQLMYSGQPPEKAKLIVPKGNIEMGIGQFSKNTTNNMEFQQWDQIKPLPVTPKNNLQQEGSFDFTTTNQLQYNTKQIDRVSEIRPKSTSKITGDFESTTTNQAMFQNHSVSKTQGIRPHTNIKLEKGDFNGETTSDREFQNWGYSKPTAIKPRSSMRQEGDMEFTTMNNMQFEGKSGERVSEIRPTTTTKISGEFDGTTTNQLTFRNPELGEKATGKRPSTNIHLERGKFEDQTTARREFQQWEISKPGPIRHYESLVHEGEMDFTTTNQTQFEVKPINRVQQFRPQVRSPEKGDFDGTTTNQTMFQVPLMEKVSDIRPKDNIHVQNGNFDDQTTSRKEFVYRSSDKPDPIKPRPNLSQEGSFDFTTSNQLEFEEKPINKVQQIRPRTKTKKSEGTFYSTTTNQAMYKTPIIDQVQGIRPAHNLQIQSGKFQDATTSNDEYRHWQVEKPKAFQLVSSLKQEGDMHFETTNNTEFQERNLERVQQIRPKTTTKIEGDFNGTTTNQDMFQQYSKLERVKPIRQHNNLYVESGDFINETTSRREFKQWVKMENQGAVPKTKSHAAGIRTHQKDRKKGKKGASKEFKEESSSSSSRDGRRKGYKGISNENTEGKSEDIVQEKVQQNDEFQQPSSDPNDEVGNGTEVRHDGILASEIADSGIISDHQQESTTADQESNGITQVSVNAGEASVTAEQQSIDQDEGNVSRKASEPDSMSKVEQKRIEQEQESVKRAAAQGRFSSEIDIGVNTQSFLRRTPPIKPSKRFKPDDNLKIEHVPFNGTSTTQTEFKKWETRRSSSKKRSQTLRQEGKMEFKTTSDDYSLTKDYHKAHERNKVKSKAGLQGSLTQTGGMEFSTTSTSSYAGVAASRAKNLRPRSSLKIGGMSTNSETAASQSSRSNPESSTQPSDMTTARADYVGHTVTRTRVNRPTTSQKVGQGRFEGKSTTSSSFVVPADQGIKTKSFKPENHKILNGENGFLGDTTYKSSFESKKQHCPVIDLEQGKSKLYFNEEVDGHRFYLPRVQG